MAGEKITKPPWEEAKETGKIVIARIMGPMIGVYYPYRKTADLYVALNEKPVHCCQCDGNFPSKELAQHIDSHDRRRKKANSIRVL